MYFHAYTYILYKVHTSWLLELISFAEIPAQFTYIVLDIVIYMYILYITFFMSPL